MTSARRADVVKGVFYVGAALGWLMLGLEWGRQGFEGGVSRLFSRILGFADSIGALVGRAAEAMASMAVVLVLVGAILNAVLLVVIVLALGATRGYRRWVGAKDTDKRMTGPNE